MAVGDTIKQKIGTKNGLEYYCRMFADLTVQSDIKYIC